MILVLDSGGIRALAGQRARLQKLRRLLRTCQVRDVDEVQAREAARLRTATGQAATISAVGAVVMAFAGRRPGTIVLTSDPSDLRALAGHAASPITIVGV